MSVKIYLHMLFFCGILCQGIFATLSDKDTNLSSDFLVRRRRVINRLTGGRSLPSIETYNFIIKIKEANRGICSGAILSHYNVITAASCVNKDLSKYLILSGASVDFFNNHSLTSKSVHYGHRPQKFFEGIALITVDPPFVYNTKTGSIQLYAGPLPTGTMVTVLGWGFFHPIERGTETRQRLRKIILPIINHEECRTQYNGGRFDITEKHICTYHTEQCCARNDEGAPLIFNDRLAGIHVWKGEYHGQRNPEVFINLQSDGYTQWIQENTLLM